MNDTQQLGPLLSRSQAGDAAAWEALLAKLRPYVRLLVRTRLGPHLGRKLDVSDIVQEALLRIHKGFQGFSGRSAPEFLGWVAQIAGHAVVTSRRYHDAEKRDAGREMHGEGLLLRFLSGSSQPEQRVLREEEAAQLAVALERLPEAQWEVIQARFFDQLPFGEISRQTGKSVGAVRVVCLRAIQRLRREMEERP
jgi:RNA polymerase sigma-70 factor (ECF subfamily)